MIQLTDAEAVQIGRLLANHMSTSLLVQLKLFDLSQRINADYHSDIALPHTLGMYDRGGQIILVQIETRAES
ncbi:hypothetical protein D3C78_885790 [compost metagenome]